MKRERMKRNQIVKKIHVNSEKIKALREANIELNRQHLLLSDKNQWYTESQETYGRGKTKETILVGWVNWREYFLDEDTGRKIWLNRKMAVRHNGEWLPEY